MSLTPTSEQDLSATCPQLNQEQRIVVINVLEERVEAVESTLRNVSNDLKNVNLDFQEAWEKINKLQEIMKLQQSIILLLLNVYTYNVTGEYYKYPQVNDNNQRSVEDTKHHFVRLGEGVHQVVEYTDARLKELDTVMNISSVLVGDSQKQERHMILPGDNMVQKSNGAYSRAYDSNKCLYRSNTEPTNDSGSAREKLNFPKSASNDSDTQRFTSSSTLDDKSKQSIEIQFQLVKDVKKKCQTNPFIDSSDTEETSVNDKAPEEVKDEAVEKVEEIKIPLINAEVKVVPSDALQMQQTIKDLIAKTDNEIQNEINYLNNLSCNETEDIYSSLDYFNFKTSLTCIPETRRSTNPFVDSLDTNENQNETHKVPTSSTYETDLQNLKELREKVDSHPSRKLQVSPTKSSHLSPTRSEIKTPVPNHRLSPSRLERSTLRYDQELAQLARLEMKLEESKALSNNHELSNQNMYEQYLNQQEMSNTFLHPDNISHINDDISPSRCNRYVPGDHKIDPKDVDNQLRQLYADSEIDRLNMKDTNAISIDDIMLSSGLKNFNDPYSYENDYLKDADPSDYGACSLDFREDIVTFDNGYDHHLYLDRFEEFDTSQIQYMDPDYALQYHFRNSTGNIPYHQSMNHNSRQNYASTTDILSSRNVPLLPNESYTSYQNRYLYNFNQYMDSNQLMLEDSCNENQYEILEFQEPSESPPPPAPEDTTYLNPLYIPETVYGTHLEVSHSSPRISPKTPRSSPKKSSATNITAISDSGLSSMSGWSGYEKSPISPKRQQTYAKSTSGSIYSNQINIQSISEVECEEYSQDPYYAEFDVLQDDNDYSANNLLPGGHRTSAFTPVRTPTFGSLQLNADNGNGFVPPPAPNGYKPKKKNQRHSSKSSDYNSNEQQSAHYIESHIKAPASNSSSSPVPDLLGHSINEEPSTPGRHNLDSRSRSANNNDDKFRRQHQRGLSTGSQSIHEEGYNAAYASSYPGGNITDALSYYPTSSKVNEAYSALEPGHSEPIYDSPRQYQYRDQNMYPASDVVPQTQYVRNTQYRESYNNPTGGVIVSKLGYISISNDIKEPGVKRNKDPTKKPRAILKSAMSVAEHVGHSVSNILPNVHLYKRKRSYSLPGSAPNDNFPVTKEPKKSGLAKFKSLSLSPSRSIEQKKHKTETSPGVMNSFGTFLKKYNKKKNRNAHSSSYASDSESEWGTQERLGSVEDSDSVFSECSPKNSRKNNSFKTGQQSPFSKQKSELEHGNQYEHETLPTDIQFNFQSEYNERETGIPLSQYQKQICLQKQQNLLLEEERKRLQEELQFAQDKKKYADELKLLLNKSESRRESQAELYIEEDNGTYETLKEVKEQQMEIESQKRRRSSTDRKEIAKIENDSYLETNHSKTSPDTANKDFAKCTTKQRNGSQSGKHKAKVNGENGLDMQRRLSKELKENLDAQYSPNGNKYSPNGTQYSPNSGQTKQLTDVAKNEDGLFFSDVPVFATMGDLKKGSSLDGNSSTDENTFSPPIIGNASREFAVSRALGKYRQRKSSLAGENGEKTDSTQSNIVPKIDGPIQVVTTDEEEEELRRNEIFEKINFEENNKKTDNIEEQTTPISFETSPINNRVRSLPPRHQQSLEIPIVGRSSGETEEDNRSTHSWRSTSRVSSRRQSTEDSIDSEDEWYIYELRKLEELERLGIQQQEYQPTEKNLETLKDFRQNKTNERQYEAEHKLESEDIESQEYRDSFDEPEERLERPTEKGSKSPEYEEDLDEEEEELEEEEEEEDRKSGGSGDTGGPDSPQGEEEYEEDRGEKQEELKPEDIVPGIPSIPRFKFDSTKANTYEAYEKDLPKEDPGLAGGPLGSKWKLVKALKERKAEEKVQAETPTPVAPTVSAIISTSNLFFLAVYFFS